MAEGVQHLISAEDFTRRDIEEICHRAEVFREADGVREDRLFIAEQYRGYAAATVFGETSTRTRCSSEVAAGKLGMNVVTLTAETSAMVKGETIGNTALTLGALGCDVVIMRMPEPGAIREAAAKSAVPVINGGDGWNEHPTQALLDVGTVLRHRGSIDDTSWVVFGDLEKSRTLNSLFVALGRFDNVRVRAVASEGLGLSDETRGYLERNGVDYVEMDNLGKAVKGADVIYGTRTQNNHRSDAKVSSVVLNEAVYAEIDPEAVILHPGPHGPEMPEFLYGMPNAKFPDEQVKTGLHVRTATIDKLLGSHAYRAVLERTTHLEQVAA